jgi:hypothetical protein
LCEGGAGVGGSDEGEGAATGGVFEGDLGVGDWVEAIGDSVVDVAAYVGRSQEAVHDLGAAHNYYENIGDKVGGIGGMGG